MSADRETPFCVANDEVIRRFCADSIDGFRGSTGAEEHAFSVRDPEARWVAKNLLVPMRAEQMTEGIIVRVATAGAMRVARYVVGLGGAARAETTRLHMLVEELAKGALRHSAKPRTIAKTRATLTERPRRRANR